MSASGDASDCDKMMRVVAAYGIALQPQVLASIGRQSAHYVDVDHRLIVEERAAVCLLRHLYPAIIAELRAETCSPARDELVAAWSKFAQQALYRSDVGLINMALFDSQILPRILEVERLVEESSPAAKCSTRHAGDWTSGDMR